MFDLQNNQLNNFFTNKHLFYNYFNHNAANTEHIKWRSG